MFSLAQIQKTLQVTKQNFSESGNGNKSHLKIHNLPASFTMNSNYPEKLMFMKDEAQLTVINVASLQKRKQ